MMSTHAPEGYICPFCLLVQGIENKHVYSKQADIVFSDEAITVFIASHWWPNNPGHVLIIPNQHIENILSLPVELSNRIHAMEIQVAKALKDVYQCDGVSSRLHNGPGGGQDVWHYHLHVYPRYKNDALYDTVRELSDPVERRAYASRLREYFAQMTDITTRTVPEERAGILHHVELNVSDLNRSSAFWGWLLTFLGYEPYQTWDKGRSWIRGSTYLVIVQTEDAYLDAGYHRKRIGLNHIALHAESRDQVDELTRMIRDRSIPLLYPDQHPHAGGPDVHAVFFEDPDRIKVEVVAP